MPVLPFTTLDVFASTRYTGNPLSVIRVDPSLKDSLSQTQKQAIAKEFNLSEIVFLHLPSTNNFSEVHVDIFTSNAEVPFAGHPTIGTTHYLLNELKANTETIVTKAGKIPIGKKDAEVKATIPFNFHIHALQHTSALTSPAITAEVVSIVKGMTFTYVPLPDLETLAKANINLHLQKYGSTYEASPLDAGWQEGLIGTMYFVEQGIDAAGRRKYRTRMFGTREDPGTGSASSGLACYLAGKEPSEKGEGPFAFAFVQGVEMGRKNEIYVEVTRGIDGQGIMKVVLSGTAVKVMEGTLEY